MPKNLAKLQKKISKKKGNTTTLNENSRDSQRLRRAGARGEKLEKLAAARAKANQPHRAHAIISCKVFLVGGTLAKGSTVQRVSYFQGAAKATDGPVDKEKIQSLIQRLVRLWLCV